MAAMARVRGICIRLAENAEVLNRNALRGEINSETGFSTIWVLMVFMLAKSHVACCVLHGGVRAPIS